MRAAVLVNPFAGGADAIEAVFSAVNEFLRPCEVVSARGFGGEQIRSAFCCDEPSGDYRPRLFAAVDSLAAQEPDFFLVAGGDGFAAYVADRLLKTGFVRPRILGVAMGTANVGPIVCRTAGELYGASPESLAFEGCGAIEAFDGGESLAYGFNDIVLGNTILGTVDGRAQTILAGAMAENGQKIPAAPLEDIGGQLAIVKNGVRAPSPLPHTAQIVVSAVERERLYGRAVSGMLCFTSWTSARAALLLSERPLVVTDYDPRGFETPALSAQILFGEEDTLVLEGLLQEVLVITDGNPYLRRNRPVTLCYRPNVVEIVRCRR